MYTQTQINLKYTDLNFSHTERDFLRIKNKIKQELNEPSDSNRSSSRKCQETNHWVKIKILQLKKIFSKFHHFGVAGLWKNQHLSKIMNFPLCRGGYFLHPE